MASRLQLEAFDRSGGSGGTLDLSPEDLEEERLRSFEKGYSAGWDDAVAAQDAEATALTSRVAQALEDMGFTYHEAQSHVLRALEPLIRDIIAAVLPAVARESLGELVVEQLMPVASEMAGSRIGIRLHPSARSVVERALAGRAPVPFDLADDITLGEGVVELRLADGERRIDIDRVVRSIAEAASAFFATGVERERAHG